MRVAFVGSYVPRRCGIATFTADTVAAVRSADPSVRCAVVAIDEPGAHRRYGPEVIGRIAQGDPCSYRDAAATINAWSADLVNLQHEFGLYGLHRLGRFEDHLRPFLDDLGLPVVTTLHTVLPHPEPWMREVVRSIASRSAEIVVMVETAARLLRDAYGIVTPVQVIPHGMPGIETHGPRRDRTALGFAGRTIVTTFGLVDPRKGLEYAIEAMPAIVARHPDALYLVIGQTHPDLIRAEGERYREGLVALVDRLGLRAHVRFVNEYLTKDDIVDYLGASDVYVTPYLDPNQITSGTLAYAMGAGRAIVSTPYLHAREALAAERGVLVGFRDASAIADAVNGIVETPRLRERLERAASTYAAGTTWDAIGARVLRHMSDVLVREPRRRSRLCHRRSKSPVLIAAAPRTLASPHGLPRPRMNCSPACCMSFPACRVCRPASMRRSAAS